MTRPRPDDVTVKTIASLERLPSSRMGNPRFLVRFTDGTSAPTQPDAGWSYGAENREYRDGPVEVHTNGRGHVTYCKRVTTVDSVSTGDAISVEWGHDFIGGPFRVTGTVTETQEWTASDGSPGSLRCIVVKTAAEAPGMLGRSVVLDLDRDTRVTVLS